MAKLTNKVAIVTGASSGIGLAISHSLAQHGAKVVMAARSAQKLKEIEKRLQDESYDVTSIYCDVTNEQDCKNLINYTISKYGKIDICVCNAGLSMRALFDDTDLSVLHKLMDVNFWGAVNCIKYSLPHIQKNKGSIIGISSVAGIHGLPARSGYSASKYALKGFFETIRIENMKKGVHVMLAYPGFVSSSIRVSALTANGDEQGKTPRNEKDMMSTERASELIVKSIIKRKRDLVMDYHGRASVFIKIFAPSLLDKLFHSHMIKELYSPLK